MAYPKEARRQRCVACEGFVVQTDSIPRLCSVCVSNKLWFIKKNYEACEECGTAAGDFCRDSEGKAIYFCASRKKKPVMLIEGNCVKCGELFYATPKQSLKQYCDNCSEHVERLKKKERSQTT